LRDVVLFNVVAIVGLRWLSTAAQMGPSSLGLWLLAMIVFFVPSGLAVMELSSRLPGEGGVYQWAKHSFGGAHGFMAGWSYWVSNLVYFPSLLLFVSGVFLFVGGSAWLGLGDDPVYNALFTLAILWIALGLNIVGLERGKWVQNVGAMGTWIAAVLLIGFGAYVWIRHGSVVSFEGVQFFPDLRQLHTLAFFATMTFGFAGLELAPIMGDEIRDPGRTIPVALAISGIVIVAVYMIGTGVLLVSVPTETIGVISGVPQALSAVGDRAGVGGLSRIGAILITLGGLGGVGAWVAGTARLPFVAGVDRYLPDALGRVHPRWGTPHIALIVQGSLATVLLVMAAVGSTVEEAYIVLVDMTIILYFIPFLYLFAALPVLRSRGVGDDRRVLRIPGGTVGVILAAVLGFVATAISLALAVVPPEGTERPGLFVLKVVGGSVVILLVGLGFYLRGRSSRG
jgi:amino acid transporter